jgi:hypothetical protein
VVVAMAEELDGTCLAVRKDGSIEAIEEGFD